MISVRSESDHLHKKNALVNDVISGGVGGFDRCDSLAQDQQAGTVTAPILPRKTCL